MPAYRERASYAWTEDSVRLIATPSVFAKNHLLYVQEIGHFRTLPAYFTERENLDSYLIVFTISGKGELNYAGKTYTLEPNQLFFIDCRHYQHYRTAAEHQWELLWVHLKGSGASGYYELFAERNEPVITLSPDHPAAGTLRELLRLQEQKSMRTELLSSKLLVELLTELLLTVQEIEQSRYGMPGYVSDVMKAMEMRFKERLTLDQLAREHAVSKYHLAKAFKQHTGFSPNEYIISLRMTRAKELLKYSDLPIADIASEIGIDNVSHFIHLFKDRTQQTPLAYRKKWQPPK